MADDITLRRRLSPPATPYNIALQGLSSASRRRASRARSIGGTRTTRRATGSCSGEAKAGGAVQVPFDLKGRTIEVSLVSKTEKGFRSTNVISDGVRATFTIGPPALTDLTFSAPDVTGDISNNGGTGDISVLRKLSTDSAFSVIQTVSAATTSFTDTPSVNGDYEYKLTQAGQDGESNTLSVTVTGAGGGAGTPPDGLSAVFDGVDTVNLSWTNHGGTGDNIVELKYGSSGTWSVAGSVGSGVSAFGDPEPPGPSFVVVYYRVYNDAVTGYSNEDHVTIPREF
jgi:hypothetical protein